MTDHAKTEIAQAALRALMDEGYRNPNVTDLRLRPSRSGGAPTICIAAEANGQLFFSCGSCPNELVSNLLRTIRSGLHITPKRVARYTMHDTRGETNEQGHKDKGTKTLTI